MENDGRDSCYLGDGLYAEFDGYHIILWAKREEGEHWVGLEPRVFHGLLEYAKNFDGFEFLK